MQEAENTGGDPLDVEMKNPNDSRERQKLLREQNIVKQVNLVTVQSLYNTLQYTVKPV